MIIYKINSLFNLARCPSQILIHDQISDFWLITETDQARFVIA